MEQAEGQQKPEIRAIDIYTNLKNYGMWDFESYPLTEPESRTVRKALKFYIDKGGSAVKAPGKRG